MTTQLARTHTPAAQWNTLQILKASRVALIACANRLGSGKDAA